MSDFARVPTLLDSHPNFSTEFEPINLHSKKAVDI
jgi:hypothetical protein